MEFVSRLEQIGYRFNTRLAFEYTNPGGNPPPEAEELLKQLPACKDEVILFLAGRGNHSDLTELDTEKKILQARKNKADHLPPEELQQYTNAYQRICSRLEAIDDLMYKEMQRRVERLREACTCTYDDGLAIDTYLSGNPIAQERNWNAFEQLYVYLETGSAATFERELSVYGKQWRETVLTAISPVNQDMRGEVSQ